MASKKKREKDHLLRSRAISIAHQMHEAGDPRSCVLVGCAMAEVEFEALLRFHFAKVSEATSDQIRNVLDSDNKNPQALLSSGWARATAALVCGAIDRNTYDLYNEIRKLRNDYAHHPGPIRLPDKLIEPMAALLNRQERESLDGVMGQLRDNEPLWGYIHKPKISTAHLGFIQCCLLLLGRLYFRRVDLEEEPKSIDPALPLSGVLDEPQL